MPLSAASTGGRDLIRAVLFDIDGTLLDTRAFIVEAFRHVGQEFGFRQVDWEGVRDMHGAALEDCYRSLAPGRESEIAGFCIAHRDFQIANLDLAAAYPSTLAVLQELADHGIRMAGVTARRSDTRSVLAHCGIDRHLTACVMADDVARTKPDPEGIFVALRALDARPDEAVMVGDATVDVLAGRAAGLARAFAVRTGFFHADEMEMANPDAILDDLSELPRQLGLGTLSSAGRP